MPYGKNISMEKISRDRFSDARILEKVHLIVYRGLKQNYSSALYGRHLLLYWYVTLLTALATKGMK